MLARLCEVGLGAALGNVPTREVPICMVVRGRIAIIFLGGVPALYCNAQGQSRHRHIVYYAYKQIYAHAHIHIRTHHYDHNHTRIRMAYTSRDKLQQQQWRLLQHMAFLGIRAACRGAM